MSLDDLFSDDPKREAMMAMAMGLLAPAGRGWGGAVANMGNAGLLGMQTYGAAKREQRANAKDDLAQLTSTYGMIKDQDQQTRFNAQLSGQPDPGPSSLLLAQEAKLSKLMGVPISSGGLLSPPQTSQSSALPPSVASQYSPVVSGSNPMTGAPYAAQGPMPQAPQPQQQPTLQQLLSGANIPPNLAGMMASQGKTGDLLKQLVETYTPKNGQAGITRLNPITGRMEIVAGNASPGQVPFTQDAQGNLIAQPIKGAAEEVGRAEGIKTAAQKAAEAPYNFGSYPVGPGGAPSIMSIQELMRREGGRPAPQQPQPNAPSGVVTDGAGNLQLRVPPAEQASRDDTRMNVLLSERADLAKQGKTDPALEREIQLLNGPQRGSGLTGPDPVTQKAREAYATGIGGGSAKDQEDLNNKVRVGQDLMMRINEARAAVDQFQPGIDSALRLKLGKIAQAMGASKGLQDRINAGDISAKEEFNKLSAQQAMESLKQALDGTGRTSQFEFKTFLNNNPNETLNRESIEKIYNLSERTYNRDFSQQQARDQYIADGKDPARWPAAWAKSQHDQLGVQPKTGVASGNSAQSTVIKFDKFGRRLQ